MLGWDCRRYWILNHTRKVKETQQWENTGRAGLPVILKTDGGSLLKFLECWTRHAVTCCHSIYSTHAQHESGDHQGPCRMIRHSWQRIANHYHILKFRRFTMHSTGSWEEIKWEAVGGQAFPEDTRRQAGTSAILVQGLRICEFNARMEKRKDPVEKGILLSPKSHPEKQSFFTMQYCIVFVYEHVPKIVLCMILGEFTADCWPIPTHACQTNTNHPSRRDQAATSHHLVSGVSRRYALWIHWDTGATFLVPYCFYHHHSSLRKECLNRVACNIICLGHLVRKERPETIEITELSEILLLLRVESLSSAWYRSKNMIHTW